MSSLDYCNSVLALSWCAASIVGTATTRTERTSNLKISSSLRETNQSQGKRSLLQLHWLPVCWRIEYKLWCIMHSVHTGRCQAYPKNTVQLAAAIRQWRSDLRSSSTPAYILPRLKAKFGERAFSHAGPSAWNALSIPTSATFLILTVSESFKTHFLA